MSLAYIRKTYNVPAKRGRRIKYRNSYGAIVSAINGCLRVRMDGTSFRVIIHPTDENLEYLVNEVKP